MTFPRIFTNGNDFIVLLGPIEIVDSTEVSQGLQFHEGGSITYMADYYLDLEHRGWELVPWA